MALALYRKYRPKTFAELADQTPIKVTLLAELEQGKVSHAYLFTGPRGIGKTTTARLLAKAVNCLKPKNGEPCNRCEACERFNAGRSLDLVEIDAASHTGVDHVREHIIESARFTPTQERMKVYVIDEVHMLSASAFNALLKTLEEPPPHVIFVLATTEVHKVPETIISRCQRFDFRKIPIPDLVKRLTWIAEQEGVRVETPVLEEVSRRSDGSSRDAEVLLGQLVALGEKIVGAEQASLVLPRSDQAAIETLFRHLVERDRVAAVRHVSIFLDEGGDLTQFVEDLIVFLRNLLLIKLGQAPETVNASDGVRKLLELVSVEELTTMIERFLLSREEFRRASIPQLPLELAIIDLLPDTAFAEKPLPPPASREKSSPPPVTGKPKPSLLERKEPRRATRHPSSLTIGQIDKKWPDVIVALRKYNHSLALTMKVSQLLGFTEGSLTVGFGFPFYLERLAEHRNKQTVEQVLEEVFGERIEVVGKVVPSAGQNPPSSESSLWDQVSAAFGSGEGPSA